MVTSSPGPTPSHVPTGDTAGSARVPVLVDVDWLRAALAAGATERDRVVVCDVRWYLDGRDARAAHRGGHLPGARFVDLDTACSAKGAAVDGRHPLPTPAAFARSLGTLGIGDDTVVVAYDDSGGGTAGRLVWMLRALGAPAVLLDGGLAAWQETGGPLDRGDGPTWPPATFTTRPWPDDRLASWAEVERAEVERAEVEWAGTDPARTDPARTASARTYRAPVLLDARAPDRYRGDVEPVDPRPGHIPGAVNLPWASLLDPATGRFRSPADLARRFAGLGIAPGDDVVASCGSGVSACALLVALEHAGYPAARLFVPSWSGWSSDPDRRAALGDTP